MLFTFMYQVEEWDNESWRAIHFDNLAW
jgi:hypothetical protein